MTDAKAEAEPLLSINMVEVSNLASKTLATQLENMIFRNLGEAKVDSAINKALGGYFSDSLERDVRRITDNAMQQALMSVLYSDEVQARLRGIFVDFITNEADEDFLKANARQLLMMTLGRNVD